MTYRFSHHFTDGPILHVFAHFRAGAWDFMDAWEGAGATDHVELYKFAGHLVTFYSEPGPGCAAMEAGAWLAGKYFKLKPA